MLLISELAMDRLVIAGLVPFTTVDMPEKNAAVIFCQGCPWRCRYCHNTHLQKPHTCSSISWGTVLEWLEQRIGLLDAVVFSGGEPTYQKGLQKAMKEIKAMGFEIGLHTGGYNPKIVSELIPILDWIGLDIKSPQYAYDRITGANSSGNNVWESLNIVSHSNLSYEIRTTYHPDLLTESDMIILATELAHANVKNWVLQTFRAKGCTDSVLVSNQHTVPNSMFLKRIEAVFLQNTSEQTFNNMHHEVHSHQISIGIKNNQRKFLIR